MIVTMRARNAEGKVVSYPVAVPEDMAEFGVEIIVDNVSVVGILPALNEDSDTVEPFVGYWPDGEEWHNIAPVAALIRASKAGDVPPALSGPFAAFATIDPDGTSADGWMVAYAEPNEPGFYGTTYTGDEDYYRRVAKSINESLGLTEDDATRMVASSIAASNRAADSRTVNTDLMNTPTHLDRARPWAHNTDTSGNGACPVVIEDPSHFPLAPGEGAEWHVATDDEYAAYYAYWTGGPGDVDHLHRPGVTCADESCPKEDVQRESHDLGPYEA